MKRWAQKYLAVALTATVAVVGLSITPKADAQYRLKTILTNQTIAASATSNYTASTVFELRGPTDQSIGYSAWFKFAPKNATNAMPGSTATVTWQFSPNGTYWNDTNLVTSTHGINTADTNGTYMISYTNIVPHNARYARIKSILNNHAVAAYLYGADVGYWSPGDNRANGSKMP